MKSIISILIFLLLCWVNLKAQMVIVDSISKPSSAQMKSYTTGPNGSLMDSKAFKDLFQEDKSGRIWYMGKKALMCFESDKTLIFDQKNGLSGKTIKRMLVDDIGRIWIHSGNQVSYYQNNAWNTFSKKNGLPKLTSVSQMRLNSEGSIEILGKSSYYKFDNGIWKESESNIYESDFGLLTQYPTYKKSNIGRTSQNLWFYCDRSVLRLYNEHYELINEFSINDQFGAFAIMDIIVMPNKNIIVTLISRTFLIEPQGSITQIFISKDTGMIKLNPSFSDYYLDNDGNVWLSGNDGIYLFTNEGKEHRYFSTLELSGGKNNFFQSSNIGDFKAVFLEDNADRMWFGNTSLIHQETDAILASVTVGKMYCSLSCFKNGNWESINKSKGLNATSINCLFEDSQGNIWVDTESMIFKIENK